MAQHKQTTKKKPRRPAKKAPSSAGADAPVAEKPRARPVTRTWVDLRQSLRFFGAHWQYFTLFTLVFALLNLILVHNFNGSTAELKSQLDAVSGGNLALTGLGTYGLLLVTGSNTSASTAAYQYILFVIASLAVIWALRQFMSDQPAKRLRVRDSLYDGMYPLVQFVVVLLVLSLELLPLAASGALYGLAISNGIAQTWLEQALWIGIFLAGAVVSVWLLVRSVFALYIVTLPGARPLQALRDSRRITKGHQLSIVRKLIVLGIFLLVAGAVVLVPTIILFAPLTGVFLFVLGIIAIPFAHTYLYNVYRDLLV